MVLTKAPEQFIPTGQVEAYELTRATNDFTRAATFFFVAREIEEKKLPGSVAELGVYKGQFAALMNRCFPTRKIYLFDTFEGFDRKEFESDKEHGLTKPEYWQEFNSTVDEVMSKMKYPDNVVVQKGYFPDTAADVDDAFVFVSLDADLYQPIYNGLCFFYPRLVKGGYIFVHDYNQPEFRGVKKAVQRFCAENEQVVYVPIGDEGGTAVIPKP